MNIYDFLSIPGFVIKKNNSRGAGHGPCERQRMYCKVKGKLQKARQPKRWTIPNDKHSSIHARWHNDYEYGTSLSEIAEEQIIEDDKRSLEDHSCVATRSERIQNTKHWVLRLNQDGAQQPPNQRHECKRLHDEYVTRTPIPRDQQVRQRRGQPFEGIDEYD